MYIFFMFKNMVDFFFSKNKINERKRKIGKYFYNLIIGKHKTAFCNAELRTIYGLYGKNNTRELKKYIIINGSRKDFDLDNETKEEAKKLINFLRKNINARNSEIFDYIIFYFYKTIKKGVK